MLGVADNWKWKTRLTVRQTWCFGSRGGNWISVAKSYWDEIHEFFKVFMCLCQRQTTMNCVAHTTEMHFFHSTEHKSVKQVPPVIMMEISVLILSLAVDGSL